MKSIDINIRGKDSLCPIIIGSNLLENITEHIDLSQYTTVCIITDTQIEKLFLKNNSLLQNQHISVLALHLNEEAKTIQTVEKIWEHLLNTHSDRSSLVINIGGGVVCDVGGFAASTYMRGIDFINVPTTLLSQVDASVGGKTGINFSDVKNLIGTFQQPQAVYIDVQTLKTLPKRILTEGFGEVIKHGLIADKNYFDFVTSKKPEEFTNEELINLIEQSCKIKAKIITSDITEKANRKLVNFGHTIGHAIEAVSLTTNNPLYHGEAVSIGIVGESYISLLKNTISEKEFSLITEKLQHAGLPTIAKNINRDEVYKKILHDKKSERGKIQWTLLNGIGKGIINQDVSDNLIKESLQKILI